MLKLLMDLTPSMLEAERTWTPKIWSLKLHRLWWIIQNRSPSMRSRVATLSSSNSKLQRRIKEKSSVSKAGT
jgi:hypothetical protein